MSSVRLLSPSELWIKAWDQAAKRNERTESDEEEERYWAEHASKYDERNPLAPYTSELMENVYRKLHPSDQLVEIGAGTGGFTKLLANHVERIAVVEPSAAMYEVFCRSWPVELAPLPERMAMKWEEAPDIQFDVVFGANAFYRIRDMKDSLLRMNACAKRHVFLVQSVGRPYAGPLEVTQEGNRIEQERADAIADILGELGIPHTCTRYPVQRRDGTTHDVALIEWRPKR